MTSVVGVLLVAAGLIVFGHWGRRNAARLVPTALSPYGQALRFHQYRRNATTCVFVGLFAMVAAILEFL